MKCETCKMEIAYSFLDGIFCSCGFVKFLDNIDNFVPLHGWKNKINEIIAMRNSYIKSTFKQ